MSTKKNKKTSKIERKGLSKNLERTFYDNGVAPLNIDSNASREGVKYCVSFLADQLFRGQFYKTGQQIVLSENDAKAYSKRSSLKIEPMEK